MSIHSTESLRARGVGKKHLAELVRFGALVRIRRGRFADSSATADEVEAVRVGGVLGCVSALRRYGVWVSRRSGVHVHLPPNSSRLRSGGSVRHWCTTVHPGDLARVSMLDALLVAMICQSLLDAVASVDSALHLGLVRMSDLRAHCHDARRRRILDLADRRAESGLETLIRVALVILGLRVEIQVVVDGTGRVDILVEGCVVVEADGAAFHSGPRKHVDYVRDAAATTAGKRALRFDGSQVLGDLPSVVAAVVAAVCQHRGVPYSGPSAESARIRVQKLVSS